MVAIAMNQWASERSLAVRTAMASLIATLPILSMATFALITLGDFPAILFQMTPAEFLIPFTVQIVLILVLAAPLAWLISRHGARLPSKASVFE
ncbi:MAG TPA: hypothetical protein VN222_08055 [Novosphingobium sp.]|nr:hypothetical protein [Novosphingobium sp.]